jgi:hypothetical protein
MGYKNKKNNTSRSELQSDTSRHRCDAAHNLVDGHEPRRPWGIIGGKALPTLAIFSLLALGVAHPFNTDGPWAQEDVANEQPAFPRAAVIADEEQGVIRFIIEGQEVMHLDATGLHIREDVSSGGPQTIYGQIGFDDHIAESADEE